MKVSRSFFSKTYKQLLDRVHIFYFFARYLFGAQTKIFTHFGIIGPFMIKLDRYKDLLLLGFSEAPEGVFSSGSASLGLFEKRNCKKRFISPVIRN